MSPEEEGYMDVLIECPFCGAYVPDDYECLMCRSELFEEIEDSSYKYICSRCGTEVNETLDKCSNCGLKFL